MYNREINIGNLNYRNLWIASSLSKFRQTWINPTLLDVGAGLSPYKDHIVDLGYEYSSHDFSFYDPKSEISFEGLHSPSWDYPKHDFVCDILALPPEASADLVLCTEVFEHIPDPVRTFEKLANLTKSGGYMIFTVPFSSLMHQAPYWFQSGLSPFWFEYWAEKFQVEVIELTVYGDYVDWVTMEVPRLFPFLSRLPGAIRLTSWMAKLYRKVLSREVLTSGGLGVFFVGKKV